MPVEPIEHTDLTIRVYQRIKEMILTTELKPGEKIIQEKLAARLGVSRMPLHKAFAMLEEEMLVRSEPRRGIFVKSFDLQEVIDAFECREGLEGVAGRRTALNITDEEIIQLEALFKPFIGKKLINEALYRKADQEFHERIIRISGNQLMQKINAIGDVLIRTYPHGIILPYKESLNDHELMIQAFRDRDPDRAERYLRAHSNKAQKILRSKLNIELR